MLTTIINFELLSSHATSGFFPDGGGSYYLPRLSGSLGMFLALTGTYWFMKYNYISRIHDIATIEVYVAVTKDNICMFKMEVKFFECL